jgi:ferredoxin-NADP reductase
VLNPKAIAFADFRGNLQYLSVGNLRRDDRISIILVDFPNRRRLKLLGRVQLVEAGDSAEGDAAIAAVADASYAATVERAFLIAIEGWDWNCPQHITPRFTEAEVGTLMTPLRTQVQKLKSQLAQAKAQAPAPPATADASAVLGDGPLKLRIAGVRQLTQDVRAYELVSDDGTALPPFKAGAHLDVPMRLEDGVTSTRSYSIASNPARRDALEIAVLRESAGTGGSAAVHESFVLGTRLRCSLPDNNFPLVDGSHRSVLVAGGIGITPLKAMAHALVAEGRDFVLHFACRSRALAPYLPQLLEQFGERVVVHAGDEGQRLDVAALVASLGGSDPLYVCGPPGLIDAVRASAATLGLHPERIHYERFIVHHDASGDRAFTVHLDRSGQTLSVPPGRTILEVLESSGLRVAASCRIGTCGTCATRVKSGVPLHRDEVLTAQQRDTEGLMCICVSRAESEALHLDL